METVYDVHNVHGLSLWSCLFLLGHYGCVSSALGFSEGPRMDRCVLNDFIVFNVYINSYNAFVQSLWRIRS